MEKWSFSGRFPQEIKEKVLDIQAQLRVHEKLRLTMPETIEYILNHYDYESNLLIRNKNKFQDY
jgi:phage pi2 protein 07